MLSRIRAIQNLEWEEVESSVDRKPINLYKNIENNDKKQDKKQNKEDDCNTFVF